MTKTLFDQWSWKPPKDWQIIETIDLHTGGEPLRVISGGLPEIPGKTILEKRRYFRDYLDYIRTGLMWEPRGHADMYGAVVTEACSEDGDFGTFFLHNEGYSTMCGHAMIALVTLMLDTGLLKKDENDPIIRIDAPPGRITATASFKANGKVDLVHFENVPSFVLMENQHIDVPGIGNVEFDIAFGGAFYAFVDAASVGLRMDASDYNRLIDYGRRIKNAVMEQFEIKHPFEEDLSFLYGTIFTGKAFNPEHHSRNVCIFAEGEVDRSPTGSGVSARAAIHHLKDGLNIGQSLRIESILGSLMDVKINKITKYGPYTAVIPEVSGSASITGQHRFYFDPEDSFKKGFIFR